MFVTVYDSFTNEVKQYYHQIPNEPVIDRGMHLYHRIPVQVGLDAIEGRLGYPQFRFQYSSFFRTNDGCVTNYKDSDDNFITVCIRFHYD